MRNGFTLTPPHARKTQKDRSHRLVCGFTIVEILVAISITALLSGLIITYTSTGRAQVALYVEEAKIAQVILKSKSLAISTYNQPDIPCGYGVYFDYRALSYALFSYRVPDCSTISTIDIVSPAVTIVERFNLPGQLAFGAAAGRLDTVFFVPPDPKTLLWVDGGFSAPSGNVYLKTKDNLASLIIGVTSSGQISF